MENHHNRQRLSPQALFPVGPVTRFSGETGTFYPGKLRVFGNSIHKLARLQKQYVPFNRRVGAMHRTFRQTKIIYCFSININ